MQTHVMLCLALVLLAPTACSKGYIELDLYTFDKIVDGSKAVFVEFGKKYQFTCVVAGPMSCENS